MTAGPFIMTNLEGLFSTFRHLESEMDELRTMRRVSRIWEEMERREQGAWTMFGRFFDRNMDEINRIRSAAWEGTGLFSQPRLGRYNDPFSSRVDSSDPEQNNVIVEFPDDKEIKITLEEPSVVITEVENTPEPSVSEHESPTPESVSNASLDRKSSLVSSDRDSLESEPKSSIYVTSVIKDSVEDTVQIVDSNNRTEKKTKKVDFSKMEVHFEPGSGKVNIVETNEKPPSSQLFRRKKRNRSVRSESPKLHFVGSAQTESYESFDSSAYDERFEGPLINPNPQINRLQNNLDLSIINLRNCLFKNSLNESSISKSNIPRSPVGLRDTNYSHNIMNNASAVDKKNNKVASKLSFRGSTKLQDMIQNSVNNQMKLVKTNVAVTKDVNSEKAANKIMTRTNCTRQIPVTVHSSVGPKQIPSDEKLNIKLKAVNRTDSAKRNARVTRQESLRSTSSRGSSNGENRLSQKKSNTKDSFRKDSIYKVHRTSSIGRSTSNSLKKGGIYVDGRPKKVKGSTVTLISYSNSTMSPNDNADKSYYNNVGANNKTDVRNKVARQGSLKSCCSKESLCSTQSRSRTALGKMTSRTVDSTIQDTDTTSHGCSCKYATLKFSGRTRDGSRDAQNVRRSIPVRKQESFNSDSSARRSDDKPKFRNSAAELVKKTITDNNINLNRDFLQNEKKFTHQDSSLFKPIKKEKPIESDADRFTDIKTPVAIRKKSNYLESKRLSPSKENIYPDERAKKIDTEKNDGYIRFTKIPSKLNLALVKRSKEPLRSFEKISNGWVGQCNIIRSRESSRFEGTVKKPSDFKVAAVENDLSGRDKPSSTSPLRLHQQREAMIRLSRGYPSRKLTSPSSSYSKENIETRKRSRNVYTPSSVSSVPATSKRRSTQYVRADSVRSDSTVPSEPVYETLSRQSQVAASSALVKRNRHSNNCCNI